MASSFPAENPTPLALLGRCPLARFWKWAMLCRSEGGAHDAGHVCACSHASWAICSLVLPFHTPPGSVCPQPPHHQYQGCCGGYDMS